MVWPSGSVRHRYSHAQIQSLYDRIDLPPQFRYEPGDFSKEVVRQRNGHGFLRALMTHMLAAVPYENLELHYSTTHHVSLDAETLYCKIVGQARGGLSLEINAFFAIVLYSLGYEVRSVGARLNEAARGYLRGDSAANAQPAFGAWSHMVNLVNIRGADWVVDIGYGYGGPTQPLQLSPLVDGEATLNIRPYQSVRLRLDGLGTDGFMKKLWLFERQDRPNGPWAAIYCFPDNIDFIPADFEAMSYILSTHRKSPLTHHVVCSRYTLDEQSHELIGASVLISDRVYHYVAGKQEEMAEFETEEGRVSALSEYFEITLSEAQKSGIQGMSTALSNGWR